MLRIPQEEIDWMIKELASKILASGVKYKQVVGIANGGLNISVPLSLILGLPHTSVHISHYDGHTPRKTPIIEGHVEGTGSLVVDDLIDGGYTIETFDRVFGLLGNDVAVLFWKRGSSKPRYYVYEKPDYWLQFPWSDE